MYITGSRVLEESVVEVSQGLGLFVKRTDVGNLRDYFCTGLPHLLVLVLGELVVEREDVGGEVSH